MLFFQRIVEVVGTLFGGIRIRFSVIIAGLPPVRYWDRPANGAVCHFNLKFLSFTVPTISVRIVDSTPRHLLGPGRSIHTNLP